MRMQGIFGLIVQDILPQIIWWKDGGQKKIGGNNRGKLRRVKTLTDGSEKPLGPEWNFMTVSAFKMNLKYAVNGDLVKPWL